MTNDQTSVVGPRADCRVQQAGLPFNKRRAEAPCKGGIVKSRVRVALGAALVVVAVVGGTAGLTYAKSGKDRTVLRADVLVGVSAPFTGAANPIRGINGGGVPWVIGESEVRLRASGRLEAEVQGLVLAATGTNPVAAFKVTVSCLSTDANGAAVTTNVSTDPVPTDAAGNAEFDTMVSLPSPCIAPIIFIANGNAAGAWFAATGV